MSTLAHFFVLPVSKVDALKDAAVIRKRGWFRRAENRWLTFLKTEANQHPRFDGSGGVYLDLDRYLESSGEEGIGACADGPLSDFICAAQGECYLVFNHSQRQALLEKLGSSVVEPGSLERFAVQEYGEAQGRGVGQVMLEAIELLREWLNYCPEDSIGLLVIG